MGLVKKWIKSIIIEAFADSVRFNQSINNQLPRNWESDTDAPDDMNCPLGSTWKNEKTGEGWVYKGSWVSASKPQNKKRGRPKK